MTLRPIPGAPIDAPIPDFPTGNPGPLVVPESRFAHRPAESIPPSPPSPEASLSLSRTRRSGPIEIRGSGNSSLTFRPVPELPAIRRSSMTIAIAGEPTGDCFPPTMPHLELTTDQAKAFLLALRDGGSPVLVADSRTGFEVEFAVKEDGPTFTVGRPIQETTLQRFNPGWGYDVKTMAEDLLAELGP